MTASCVCSSDLWPYRGVKPTRRPSAIGHEFIGVVESTGADVTELKAGDFVIAPFVVRGEDRQKHYGGRRHGSGSRLHPRTAQDVLAGGINPGRVFDVEMPLEEAPEAYKVMDERRAIKVLLRPKLPISGLYIGNTR